MRLLGHTRSSGKLALIALIVVALKKHPVRADALSP